MKEIKEACKLLHKPINIKVKVFKGFELHLIQFFFPDRGMSETNSQYNLFNSLFHSFCSIQIHSIIPTELFPFFLLDYYYFLPLYIKGGIVKGLGGNGECVL